MNLRQALILAINTSILAVLFAFSSWLYLRSRAAVDSQVDASLSRSAAMAARLAELREKELSGLARSLAVSPMLRGALATGHGETIRDVLASLRQKNGLGHVAVLEGTRLVYSAASEAPAGRGFSGEASLGDDERRLSVSQEPAPELLEDWTAITGARFALGADAAAVHNLPAEDAAAARRALGEGAAAPGAAARVVEGSSGRYYVRALRLRGGMNAALFAPVAPFWRDFEATRNSLVVLGACLFFLGLLLSVGFAALIERHAAPADPAARDAVVRRLVEEMERARAGRAG